MLAILLDVARRPIFPESELEQPRAETVTALRQDDDSPAVRALDAVAALIYGPDHPYARKAKGTFAAVERIRRDDLLGFHAAWVRPSCLTLAIVGDVEPAMAITLAAAELEDWTAAPAEHVPVTPPASIATRRVVRIAMPGKSQSDIAYGFNTIRRLDPRYYAYWMMNNVLGQFGLGGRLADNIRVTSSDHSDIAPLRASDADRDRAAATVATALAEGRLTPAEHVRVRRGGGQAEAAKDPQGQAPGRR